MIEKIFKRILKLLGVIRPSDLLNGEIENEKDND